MYDYLSQARKVLEPKDFRHIHQKCESAVNDLKSCESQSIYALQEADKFKVYRYLGKNSLFQYALSLGLSESQAYNYITVARKSRECPELQKAIDKKEITISKARAVSGVIREDNQIKWIQLAKTSTKRELEKAVAQVSPRALKKESARFINDHTLELQLPVSEEIFKQLERVKDLLAQKHRKHISLEETLGILSNEFIKKHDPVQRAKRRMSKVTETTNSNNHTDVESKSETTNSNNHVDTESKTETKNSNNHADTENKIEVNYCKNNVKVENRSDAINNINHFVLEREIDTLNNINHANLDTEVNDSSSRITIKTTKEITEFKSKCDTNKANTKSNLKAKNQITDTNSLKSKTQPVLGRVLRKKLSAELVNKINYRDQGQCQFELENNQICGQSRWVEYHHITPLAYGGQDQLDNLITLCSEHHKQVHLIKNKI